MGRYTKRFLIKGVAFHCIIVIYTVTMSFLSFLFNCFFLVMTQIINGKNKTEIMYFHMTSLSRNVLDMVSVYKVFERVLEEPGRTYKYSV